MSSRRGSNHAIDLRCSILSLHIVLYVIIKKTWISDLTLFNPFLQRRKITTTKAKQLKEYRVFRLLKQHPAIISILE